MSGGNVESIITSNPDIFTQSDFVTDFLRVIGWKIIMMLRSLTRGVETLFDAVYDFLNITNSSVFQDYYNQYRYLITVAFIVSILFLGTIYLLTEKRAEVMKNFFIFKRAYDSYRMNIFEQIIPLIIMIFR